MFVAALRRNGLMRVARMQTRTKIYAEVQDGEDPNKVLARLSELYDDDGTNDKKLYHETKSQKRIRKRSEAAVRIINKQIGSAVAMVARHRRRQN